MQANLKDYIHLHFIVFLWGFTVILGNLIQLPSVEMLVYRVALTTATYFVLLYIYKKKQWYHINDRQFLYFMIIGFIIAAHWVFFYTSAKISSASICLAGFATTTLWASIVDPIINKKKFSFLELSLGFVILIGLYLIYRFEYQYSLGLLLGVLAAFTSALFTAINSKLSKQSDVYTMSFYEMLGVFIALLLFLPVYSLYIADGGLQWQASLQDWGYLLVLVFLCTVYTFINSIRLLKKFSAFMMNLSVNMEPVYGIVMAAFILNEKEKMSLGFYFGAVIIIGCVLSYPYLKN